MAITRTPWIDDDGSGTTGTIINNAEKQALYNQIDASAAFVNATNTFVSPQRVQGNAPQVLVNDLSAPVEARLFDFVGYAQTLQFRALNDAATTIIAQPLTLNRDGSVMIAGRISEQNRTTPMGHPIDVPHNPADYTAADGGTWVISTAYVNAYALVGKVCTYNFYTVGNITGAPTQLFYRLPVVPSRYAVGTCAYVGNMVGTGGVQLSPGNPVLMLTAVGLGGAWAAGTVYLGTSISFFIQ
jgi:hypothetical protein